MHDATLANQSALHYILDGSRNSPSVPSAMVDTSSYGTVLSKIHTHGVSNRTTGSCKDFNSVDCYFNYGRNRSTLITSSIHVAISLQRSSVIIWVSGVLPSIISILITAYFEMVRLP